jgi:hypothetical protein
MADTITNTTTTITITHPSVKQMMAPFGRLAISATDSTAASARPVCVTLWCYRVTLMVLQSNGFGDPK